MSLQTCHVSVSFLRDSGQQAKSRVEYLDRYRVCFVISDFFSHVFFVGFLQCAIISFDQIFTNVSREADVSCLHSGNCRT